MKNYYDLSDKSVLITGALGQIGRVLVQSFLNNNASVYAVDLLDRNEIDYGQFKATDKGSFSYISGDIRSKKMVEMLIERIFTPIDVLVNCAGIGVYTPFEERTEEELDNVIATNLKGTIWMSQVISVRMIKQGSGSIINFGSIYGITTPDFSIYGDSGRNSSEIYGASKAGIIHFTKYLAAYLAPYGINANVISPGGVFRSQDPAFVRNYEKKTPLGRMASPEDLAGATLFLASPDASYITGQCIAIDGGFTVW